MLLHQLQLWYLRTTYKQTQEWHTTNQAASNLLFASAKLNYCMLAWLFMLFWWGSPIFHNLLIRRLGSNSSHVKSNWRADSRIWSLESARRLSCKGLYYQRPSQSSSWDDSRPPILGKYWKVFDDRYVFDDGQFYFITASLARYHRLNKYLFLKRRKENMKHTQQWIYSLLTFFLSKRPEGQTPSTCSCCHSFRVHSLPFQMVGGKQWFSEVLNWWNLWN
jgi:hypothetical protein